VPLSANLARWNALPDAGQRFWLVIAQDDTASDGKNHKALSMALADLRYCGENAIASTIRLTDKLRLLLFQVLTTRGPATCIWAARPIPADALTARKAEIHVVTTNARRLLS
jgi:hypothetical protein